MRRIANLLFLIGLGCPLLVPAAQAAKQTVCTVTVNSSDEKEAFQRSLPADKFQFVELLEPGRSDWLASACRKAVQCDVLVVSGHHDGESGFFSDRAEADEYLSPDELDRASCSDSCPGVFAHLKEVHLFGCNTLNPEPVHSASPEVARSLVRSGHSRADAERIARALSERHADSTRERMREIFKNVPAIYGFSSVAPLGPTAASFLNRYFRAGGTREVATGRPSAKLLTSFAGHSLTAVRGLKQTDPQAAYRSDVCQFYDARLSAAQKVGFIHELLQREIAEARMFLDHIERYSASLTDSDRNSPGVARALERIARDESARNRYLDFARDTDLPTTRARMIEVASQLGWLTVEEKHAELVDMVRDRLVRNAVGPAEVDLVCRVNASHQLDQARAQLADMAPRDRVSSAAVLACLGDDQAHARVLQALTSQNDRDSELAEAYLHQRPLQDASELRSISAAIARMPSNRAQVRALDALARQRVSDPATLEGLTGLYAQTDSVDVQVAIAGILVRADYAAIARPEIVNALRQHRIKAPGADGMLDVLMRQLQPRQSVARLQASPPKQQ
ncbi:MAG: hypothetical protein M3Z31_08835 [Pseudomonadota bacterium]|nr:hypothetical protein [Pseudomonadota bacterium]